MINCPRFLESILQAEASQDKVYLLFGARQTGKSTLLQRIAESDAEAFNLQERRTRLDLERDPHVFTQILEAENRNPAVVCVDEIQKVPAQAEQFSAGFSEPLLENLLLFSSFWNWRQQNRAIL